MKSVKIASVLIFVFLLTIVLVSIVIPSVPAAAASPGVGDLQVGTSALTPEQTAFVQFIATRAGWLGLVIGLDLLLGVVVALKQKIFRWDKLADFLADYGPKVVAWLALEALGLLPPELKQMASIGEGLGLAAYGLILLSAAASVLGHVQAIGVLPVSLPGVAPTKKN